MRKFVSLLAVGFAAPLAAQAAAPTLDEVLTASGVTLAGYVDSSYVFGKNKGDTLLFRTFDSKTGSFTFNQAAFTVSKLPAEGFGGLVNVIAGDDATVINGSYGDGSGKFNLTQAYVQYATGGLTIIGGRYVTLAGAEVINDTLNTNISRSFLFQLAEPLAHTGVRSSYKFSDAFTAYLGAANSAVSGLASDNNKQKTVEAGVAITPTSALSIGLYDYYGHDPVGGEQQKTNYADLVISLQAADALQFIINADYVKFFSTDTVQESNVKGVAGYVNVKLSDSLKASLRAEYLKSHNGFVACGGGTDCNLKEVTLTLDYAAAKNFDLLGELRYDKGSDAVFLNGTDPLKDSQGDIALKAIYKF